MKKMIFLGIVVSVQLIAMEIIQTTHAEDSEKPLLSIQQHNTQSVDKQFKKKRKPIMLPQLPAQSCEIIQEDPCMAKKLQDQSRACCFCGFSQCAAFGVAGPTLMSNGIPDPCCMACCCCKIPMTAGLISTLALSSGGCAASFLTYIILSWWCTDADED